MSDFENTFSFFFGGDDDEICLYCKSSEGDLVTSQPGVASPNGLTYHQDCKIENERIQDECTANAAARNAEHARYDAQAD